MDSFPDSSEDVLNDLDPLSRALLDLSIQRGMDDGEIAQVLGTDETSVFEVRVGLLRNGFPMVRMTKSTSVCVASDSTNHPVWNSRSLA